MMKKKRGQFVVESHELCYSCHDNFKDSYNYVHGPVAGGYCTACHKAHSSKIPKLLIVESPGLCVNCHDDIKLSARHDFDDFYETSCIECHNPHGGEDKYILN